MVTSFGMCSLMEDECGDALLLDKILLCFLNVQERTEMNPKDEENRTESHPYNSNLSNGTFFGSVSFT